MFNLFRLEKHVVEDAPQNPHYIVAYMTSIEPTKPVHSGQDTTCM